MAAALASRLASATVAVLVSSVLACSSGQCPGSAPPAVGLRSYFPPLSTAPWPDPGLGYAELLQRMNEPPLASVRAEGGEVYRLLILTFTRDRRAMAIRAIPTVSGARRVATGLSPEGELTCGDTALSSTEWTRIRECFADPKFLNLSVAGDDTEIVADGETWVLEALRAGRYQVVTRDSPDVDTAKRDTAERGLEVFMRCARLLSEVPPGT